MLDASGLVVLPGGVDMHVHFRDMDEVEKETWRTGSRAAAAGGVTCVVDQPNTSPPTTDLPSLERKLGAARNSSVDFRLNGALHPDSDLEALAPRVAAFGEAFTTDGGLAVTDLEPLLRRAAELDVLCTIHAEDPSTVERGLSAHGGGAPREYSVARPPEAEVEAVEAAVSAGRRTGADLHFCHVSTPEGAHVALDAGYTAECTPHHLLLNRGELDRHGALAKCNPPLRDEETRRGLWDLFVSEGLVAASDHAPHGKRATDEFWEAPPGVPGVQTMVPVLLARCVEGELPLERVVDACAERPARILGLPKGRIAPGMDADLALYDLDRVEEIEASALHSKAGYSLFGGRRAVFPVATIVEGIQNS